MTPRPKQHPLTGWWRRGIALAPWFVLAAPALAAPQDLYDEQSLHTFELVFTTPTWQQELVQRFGTGQPLRAALLVDGAPFGDVGVHHKGDASYTYGSTPREPFKVDLDAYVPGQDLWGHDVLTLDNGRQSSVFNEVVALWICAELLVAPRANLAHVRAGVPGAMLDLGVYTSTERVDREFFTRRFGSADGHRYERDEANPLLPLPFTHHGSDPAGYTVDYAVQGGAAATEYFDVRDVAVALHAVPTAQLIDAAQPILDVDAVVRTLAVESLCRNVDGLWRGNNYFLFEDVAHGGRLTPIPWDLDRALINQWLNDPVDMFCGPGDYAECPLSRVLEPRAWQRRLAAYERHLLASAFDWARIEPRLLRLRDLAAPAMLGSPYDFVTSPAVLDARLATIRDSVVVRANFLANLWELVYSAPSISGLGHSPAQAPPAGSVWVTADVALVGPALGEVLLWSRGRGPFHSTPMLDDGLHGDGGPGDGRFGAAVPPATISTLAYGDALECYVEARAQDLQQHGLTLNPPQGEFAPYVIPVDWPTLASPVRLTELCYSGDDGEFIELCNVSSAPVDLTGWSLDDESATPGGFDLSGAGVLAPGETVVVTDVPPAAFRAAWGLAATSAVLGPNTTAAFGRNDAVHVFDDAGRLRDRFRYGDEAHAGSARARDRSLVACDDVLGLDRVYSWTLAAVGDAAGSRSSAAGDVGGPGAYARRACRLSPLCSPNAVNSTGAPGALVAYGDLGAASGALTLRASSLPVGSPTLLLVGPGVALVPGAAGALGTLCVGGPVGRDVAQVRTADVSGVAEFLALPYALPGPNGPRAAQVGEEWRFQCWYRDGGVMPRSLFSDALLVRFTP